MQANNLSQLCKNVDVFDRLFSLLNSGNTSLDINNTECSPFSILEVPKTYTMGRLFYAYVTPVILVVGIIGNCLSLIVFLSKSLRNLSASSYLAALSVSDMSVLLFYVTVEWLKRGLVYLDPETKLYFLEQNGICQVILYFAYASRFLSPWLVTAFTLERYIGVCHPLLRRQLCSTHRSRQIILGIIITSCIIVIYKPILSGVYLSHDGVEYCTASKDYNFLTFVLDSSFALVITFIPFIIISVLNVLIMRRLCLRQTKLLMFRNKGNCVDRSSKASEESIVKLEFTLILFTISFCFITFNAPYSIVWVRNFLQSKHLSKDEIKLSNNDMEYWQGILYFSRTIFYMNYCVNFFLYSISGMSFRRKLKQLFTCKHPFDSHRFSRSSTTNPSWV